MSLVWVLGRGLEIDFGLEIGIGIEVVGLGFFFGACFLVCLVHARFCLSDLMTGLSLKSSLSFFECSN